MERWNEHHQKGKERKVLFALAAESEDQGDHFRRKRRRCSSLRKRSSSCAWASLVHHDPEFMGAPRAKGLQELQLIVAGLGLYHSTRYMEIEDITTKYLQGHFGIDKIQAKVEIAGFISYILKRRSVFRLGFLVKIE